MGKFICVVGWYTLSDRISRPFMAGIGLDPSSVQSVRETLSSIVTAQAALSALSRFIEQGILPLKGRLALAHNGINSLPDELLALIARQLKDERFWDDPDDEFALIQFTSVCRRFRKVALDVSELWTTIFSEASPG
ncbi:hypothetical protein DFH11DRAFT_699381 [Phellopilus nigrolimitatus]|nr:hypothetical protein DFH11DRAFT_699381 [Phellopilus nigrolimitatus]